MTKKIDTPKRAENKRQVFDIIAKNPGITSRQIAEMVEVNRSTVKHYLTELFKDELVIRNRIRLKNTPNCQHAYAYSSKADAFKANESDTKKPSEYVPTNTKKLRPANLKVDFNNVRLGSYYPQAGW